MSENNAPDTGNAPGNVAGEPIAATPAEPAAAATPAPAPAAPPPAEGGAATGADPEPAPVSAEPAPAPVAVPSDEPSADERMKALEAELATMKEAAGSDRGTIERMEARLAEQRKHMFAGALQRLNVREDMREYASLALGDIDVSTDKGRAKLTEWVAGHPGVVERTSEHDKAKTIAEGIAERAKKRGGIAARLTDSVKIESEYRRQRETWRRGN